MRDRDYFSAVRKCKYKAIIISIIFFVVCMAFLFILHYVIKQEEILDTTSRYMAFENKVERLIYTNITLIRGYEAYIKSTPNLDEDDAYRYLEDLLFDMPDIIRNIEVIKDTTILWNYPDGTNKLSIGVDLSQIKEQSDWVLKVKNEMKPVLQGPVNIIQGGTGFFVRVPLTDKGGSYWGQISIVLRSDKLLDEIGSYAKDLDIDVAISNHGDGESPFYGSLDLMGKHAMEFHMDPELIDWEVTVDTRNPIKHNLRIFVLLTILASIISATIGVFVYRYFKFNYKIRDMSIRDFLTGMYNRRFLDEYQGIVLSAAKRDNHKAAIIMLDLNDFKQINDVYGHAVGDLVLMETSRILKGVTRGSEAAFRLGGDEFLMVIPEIKNKGSLKIIIERLSGIFSQGFNVHDHKIKVSLSIGYALFPEDGEDIDSLLKKADERLYAEKTEYEKNKL